MSERITVRGFHDPATGTVSYVVWDRSTRRAAVVDPVLDYDAKSGHIATRSVDRLLACLAEERLGLDWILETHAHADHLSGAQRVKAAAGGRIAIGENICEVQATFARLFNFDSGFVADGRQFDHLFADDESFMIGSVEAVAMLVAGHTPADLAYRIDDAVFVGDTLFMPDVGSARTDFPGGSASQLYRSIQRLLALPPDTRIFVCHDYPPADRSAQWETTVRAQRKGNVHVRDGIDEAAFVAMREARDATLDAPALILPSIQVNVRGGRLPPEEGNGVAYLRIPVNALPVRMRG